jgi:hypothetical protein
MEGEICFQDSQINYTLGHTKLLFLAISGQSFLFNSSQAFPEASLNHNLLQMQL